MRSCVLLMILAASASAQAIAPSTRPVSPAPATRPSIEQLHAQAYDLMRAGQTQKAGVLLEQAYRARPLAEHDRALVLNHALLDIQQKVNAMRAAKDLREYLRLHPEPDDQATNLLGAALQL